MQPGSQGDFDSLNLTTDSATHIQIHTTVKPRYRLPLLIIPMPQSHSSGMVWVWQGHRARVPLSVHRGGTGSTCCSAKCRAEEFLSVWGLTVGIFQINLLCGWKAVISWGRSSSIKGLERTIHFFRKLWSSERLWTSDTFSYGMQNTPVSPGSSKSSFGPPPKPGAVQKAPEFPVLETPVIQETDP